MIPWLMTLYTKMSLLFEPIDKLHRPTYGEYNRWTRDRNAREEAYMGYTRPISRFNVTSILLANSSHWPGKLIAVTPSERFIPVKLYIIACHSVWLRGMWGMPRWGDLGQAVPQQSVRGRRLLRLAETRRAYKPTWHSNLTPRHSKHLLWTLMKLDIYLQDIKSVLYVGPMFIR